METSYEYKTGEGVYIIKVSLYISTWSHDKEFNYDIGISFIPKGKRKPIFNTAYLNKIPKEVILEAKLKFWNTIKPN